MDAKSPDLPQIAAIFRGIKTGKHWCFGDPEYDDLSGELFERYRAFFSQLELTLHRDARGFIYATADDDDHKGSELVTRLVIFTAVWIDATADAGEDIGRSLFAPQQAIADLPHLRSESHRRALAQVGIVSADDLHGMIRAMERLGLAEFEGPARFTLRVAFHRLLDVCLEASGRDDPPSTAPATSEPADSPAPPSGGET